MLRLAILILMLLGGALLYILMAEPAAWQPETGSNRRTETMTPKLLTKDEFQATFGSTMRDVIDETTFVIDIWPYVSKIPSSDFAGHAIHGQMVNHVYRTPDDRYDHVLVSTHTENVFLVVVVDLENDAVFGHHLLNLNEEYGLE